MKKTLAAIALSLLVSTTAFAQTSPTPITPPPDGGTGSGGGSNPNLSYHGGVKVQNAKLTYIFWGWSAPGGIGSGEYTSDLIAFRQYGMPNHLSMLDQYNATQSAGLLNSGAPDVFDPVAPAPNITDVDVQHEIQKYFHNQIDPYNIYAVVLPRGVTVTGPVNNLRSCDASGGLFCGYHWEFWDVGTWGSTRARYTVIPFPECPVCHPSGWGDAAAAEIWDIHEARETMTDPHRDAWYDGAGNEADDKCTSFTFTEFAPAPPPYYSRFFTFGYQREWSNAVTGCVQ